MEKGNYTVTDMYVFMTDDSTKKRNLEKVHYILNLPEKNYMKEILKTIKKMVKVSNMMRTEKNFMSDHFEMICVMEKEPYIIHRERKNTLVCFTTVSHKEKDFLKMEKLSMKDNFTGETLSKESNIIFLEVI